MTEPKPAMDYVSPGGTQVESRWVARVLATTGVICFWQSIGVMGLWLGIFHIGGQSSATGTGLGGLFGALMDLIGELFLILAAFGAFFLAGAVSALIGLVTFLANQKPMKRYILFFVYTATLLFDIFLVLRHVH